MARPNWSRILPRPLVIPTVIHLSTLAEVRALLDRIRKQTITETGSVRTKAALSLCVGANTCSTAIEQTRKGQVRSGCPPTARALPAKRNFKRGAFGSPKSAARQKIYAISSASSMANALTVYFEKEPGRRAAANSPATRRGASPPTSPSCRSCCRSHGPLSTHFRYDLNFGHFAALRSLTSWAKAQNRCAIVCWGVRLICEQGNQGGDHR